MADTGSEPTLWAGKLAEASGNPLALERLYREAVRGGEGRAFTAAVDNWYSADPDDRLAAAWFFRLAESGGGRTHWLWAIPIAVLNGLVAWLLSDFQQAKVAGVMPLLVLLSGPIIAIFVTLYLATAGRRRFTRRDLWLLLLPVLTGVSVFLVTVIRRQQFASDYSALVMLDLWALSWGAIGIFVLGADRSMSQRFAFLSKSYEVIVTGGLFGAVLGILVSITVALFQALGVELPELVQRLLLAGGAGMVPVLAVALVYDPALRLNQQTFDEGIGKIVTSLLRIFLPAAFVVLAVYVVFIPFRFLEPFRNREVLITYTIMSFAVVGLLLGVTPVSVPPVGSKYATWLRRGVIGVAILALLVSVYALAAILTRTIQYGITPNRLAFTGWLLVNTVVLALMLVRQWLGRRTGWVAEMHATFGTASVMYIGWAAVVVLIVPLFFLG